MKAARPIHLRPAPDAKSLEGLSDLHPVLARVFAMRGVVDVDELDYGLSLLAPVGALENIDAAVDLLLGHRDKRIVIVGDFDVDGATSTALLIRCMNEFGFAEIDYLVPNRFEYGYGLSPEIVDVAAKSRPSLLVTVDNGISSVAGVQRANELGIPVLVTDHHLPPSELPEATVIVNPNLEGSTFPSGNLAGVGVAFYLMAALGRRLQQEGRENAAKVPARYLDLVALGTIADVVPLDHNNRVLVQQGLARIRVDRTVAGIRALLHRSNRKLARTVGADLGFVVGPRLNAAGRLEDMSVGIECLLTDDHGVAEHHAALLDEINKERREIESSMREQAFAFVDAMDAHRLPGCVCVYEKDWHQGVVGLVAARVKERCHRPVVAFAQESAGTLKGSARSIPGVHIRDLLEAVSSTHPGLIIKFGGHAMAAGLNIEASRYDDFAGAIAEQMKRLYPNADFSGAIVTDGGLPADSLNLEFARTLRDSGPWGSAFPEPLWSGDFAIVEQRTVGESHLKLRVRPADGGDVIDAIAFNQAGPSYRGVVQLAYRLDVNEYRGIETPQLVVEQIATVHTGSA